MVKDVYHSCPLGVVWCMVREDRHIGAAVWRIEPDIRYFIRCTVKVSGTTVTTSSSILLWIS